MTTETLSDQIRATGVQYGQVLSPEAKQKYDRYIENLVQLSEGTVAPQVDDAEFPQWLDTWSSLGASIDRLMAAPPNVIDKLLARCITDTDGFTGRKTGIMAMVIGAVRSTSGV